MGRKTPGTLADAGSDESPKRGPGSCSDANPLGGMIFRTMRAIHFEEEPIPELDALPISQFRLLMTVHHSDNASMKELSERLRISQSSVTKLADSLVRRGFIVRIPDPEDRRMIRLQTHETARKLLEEGRARKDRTFNIVWESLSEAEQQEVTHGLTTLIQAAKRYRAAQGHPHFQPSKPPEEGEPLEKPPQPVIDVMNRSVRGKSSPGSP